MWIQIEKKEELKKHTLKTHSVEYQENLNIAVRESTGKRKCNICGHITNSSDINNHIKKEHPKNIPSKAYYASVTLTTFILILDVVYILVSFS